MSEVAEALNITTFSPCVICWSPSSPGQAAVRRKVMIGVAQRTAVLSSELVLVGFRRTMLVASLLAAPCSPPPLTTPVRTACFA